MRIYVCICMHIYIHIICLFLELRKDKPETYAQGLKKTTLSYILYSFDFLTMLLFYVFKKLN